MIIRSFTSCLVLLALSLGTILLGGCGAQASRPVTVTAAPTATANSSASSAPAAQATPPVSFASVDSGVVAFKEACAARDGDRITETMRWLSQQGESAVGPMGQLANDNAAEAGTRVAAARVLAMIGSESATQQLIAASQTEESLVRVKAAESLGSIRPATTPIVDRLLVMLDDPNHQVVSATIRSLERLGPQAKRAEPQLQAILNSDGAEQHRQEAHDALKKIAPRVGFRQGELDE